MNEFILMIEENIAAITAALAGGNILIIAATIIRTFSQRSLNRSFDMFKEGAQGLVNKSMTIDQVTRNFTDVVTNVKGSVDRLTTQIGDLDFNNVYTLLQQTVSELNVVKEALDYKDKLIESYQKDMHDIRIRMMQLEGKSGYPEAKVK